MAKKTTMKASPDCPVLVTTCHRGVFFGYADYKGGDTIDLKKARNVLYWGKAVKGFLGLAAIGPDSTCRVGPSADVYLLDVTSVSKVTPEAVEKFEAAPWSNN